MQWCPVVYSDGRREICSGAQWYIVMGGERDTTWHGTNESEKEML